MAGDNQANASNGGDEPKMPAAGPHAKPELTNPDNTPGTGALPSAGEASDNDMQPTS
jgi:hypothetical protein